MRKFDRVLLTRRHVTNKTPASSISQPFVSAPSTPPPLTRDASRTSSSPDSAPTCSNSTRYTPYTNSRRPTPANAPSIYKQLEKVVQPVITNRAKAAGKQPTIAERELASQCRLAEINTALQKSQKPLAIPTQSPSVASSSRHTQPPRMLPSQSQSYSTANKGKDVVRKHPYPFNRKCHHCGRFGHQSQDCRNRKCRWCNSTGHFPCNCMKHPRNIEEEKRNDFYDTADIEDHWDEDAKANITGEPYRN